MWLFILVVIILVGMILDENAKSDKRRREDGDWFGDIDNS
jgi:hypothetical protein